MKVFISWSGRESHAVAMSLKEWLPLVIQSLKPFVSSDDIAKGGRWSPQLGKQLDETSFGIVCLTKENLNAPWILFEAGALSKSFDEGRVAPVLFGVNRSDVTGPLLQFQSTIIASDDVLNLLKSINSVGGVDIISEQVLVKAFEKWWPDLDAKFNEIRESKLSNEAPEIQRDSREMLEEILDNTRELRSRLKISTPTETRELIRKAMVAGLSPESPEAKLWNRKRGLIREYEEILEKENKMRGDERDANEER